jgi:hypothetical protein
MTQKGVLFILVVLAVVYTKRATSPASYLAVPALHALTRMGIDCGGTIKCIEDAQEARRCIEDAQEARNRSGTPCQQRPTHGVGSPRWGPPLLGGVSRLRDRAHGVCFKSAQRGTRVRGSWCLYCGQRHSAVDRQVHALLVLHSKCVVFTTSCRTRRIGRTPRTKSNSPRRQLWVRI